MSTDTSTTRSEAHASFTLERHYRAPVDRVWHALTVDEARAQWFPGGEAFETTESVHDFRVGGRAVQEGQWHGGPQTRFEATYTDIVDHERIVYCYDMWLDNRHLSTSVTTIRLDPDDGGTRLTFTEQGVHLDGLDSPAGREEGTDGLLDQLGAYLET